MTSCSACEAPPAPWRFDAAQISQDFGFCLMHSEPEQAASVKRFDELNTATDQSVATCERKLSALDELKKSLLHQAFSGQL